jgi:hypothetical protein
MTGTRATSVDAHASNSAHITRRGTLRLAAIRTGAVLLTALSMIVTFGCTGNAAEAAVVPGSALYVSPAGSDANTGFSAGSPFKTIQYALNLAKPGVTISLAAGSYHESVHTVVDGTAQAPIVIKGTGAGTGTNAPKVTVYGTGHVFDIDNSNYRLDGFAINGEEGLVGKTFPTSLSQVGAFKDANQSLVVDSRPIYVSANDPAVVLTNVTIANMTVSGSGGECIRFRNTNSSMVINSVVSWCGVVAKQTDGAFLYHNGEGIYIGSSPKNGAAPDTSSYNVMTGNRINTFGSECLDTKENSHDNTFANNDCGYNAEPAEYYGSNIELRGYHNTLDSNRISNSMSLGVKLKSDTAALGVGQNSVTRNTFSGQLGYTIRNEQTTLGTVCGNKFPAGGTWYRITAAAAGAACA